jgi:uncharacterized ferritin-like protein (DUF455 family)
MLWRVMQLQSVRTMQTLSSVRSLYDAALLVLSTPDPHVKASLTRDIYARYQRGEIQPVGVVAAVNVPDYPARPANLQVVAPKAVPKRSVGLSNEKRISMVHSLAHIESWAIDLSWDIVARFAFMKELPEEFYGDWAKVADDEARHFGMLSARLQAMGSHYGSCPVHDALWESAMHTKDSVMARLAVEHMVHEGRGLDATPKTIDRFRSFGDIESAEMLSTIYEEEITHVAAGIKWFRYLSGIFQPGRDPATVFHETVRTHFHGNLRPPFNHDARGKAGMTRDWYEPLAITPVTP